VPLSVWFAVSLFALPSFEHPVVVAWMSQGWTALLLILFVLIATWHSQLGVRVVVEDYVHETGSKTLALVLIAFTHVFIAAASVFAILKVAFGAAR
jgi:succinate dehydrogenase / fumarate reductase membrane anchor subunit